VNIKAVMSTLDLWDLDHAAKHALLVVACRAGRQTATAEVSIPRVAADMKVSYVTAWAALDRAVKAGYLSVDKSAGKTSVWHLAPSLVAGVTPLTDEANPYNSLRGPLQSLSGEGFLEKREGERVSLAHLPASESAPGENLPVAHPPDCICRGIGLIRTAGRLVPCEEISP
jgi:hypothetical protein